MLVGETYNFDVQTQDDDDDDDDNDCFLGLPQAATSSVQADGFGDA
jgi:hypothetical protein